MTDKLTYTMKEAAELIGVSVDTLYRWRSKGVNGRRLKTFNTGVERVTRKAIDEFLASVEKAA